MPEMSRGPNCRTKRFLEAVRTGRVKDAVEEAIRHYVRDVYRFIRAMVSDPFIVEDLVQETFLEAFRSAPRFRGSSKLRTWLLGIARHIALRSIEQERARKTTSLEAARDMMATEQSPEQSPQSQELIRSAWSLVTTLPPRDRELIVLFYGHGLTYGEIADLTRRREGALRVAIFRALSKLRALTGGEEET